MRASASLCLSHGRGLATSIGVSPVERDTHEFLEMTKFLVLAVF
jgi:hypothetical protein